MTLALTKWRLLSIQPNSFPRLAVTMLSALGLLFAFAYWQQGTKLRRQNNHFASQLPFRNFPHSTDYTYRSADRSCLPVAERNQSSPGATMESRVGIKKARQIANGGYGKIQPGSGPVSFVGLFVMALSKLQHKRGLFGSVGELGVHHGRFTVVLYITARTTEKLVAVDIFMQQGKNQDGSGKGDLERFFAALKYVDIGKDDLDVLHIGGTTELPFDWHERQEFEPFRMVSVDAGHTAVLTYNDLEVTACSTMSGGIIILDDFFHPHWTGVTEGWYHYLSQGHDSLYPILLCDRKLYATNQPDAHRAYYEGLLQDEHVGKFVFQSAERWGGSKSLEMNGYHYLICDPVGHIDKHIRNIWVDLVY